MAIKLEKTEYVKFKGKANWTKVYKPDEYEGAVRWTLRLDMDDPEEIKKFKDYFPKKKLKDQPDGSKSWNPMRPTSKKIKDKLVYFTAPIVYNKEGEILAGYTDEEGHLVRQYDDPKKVILTGGERPLIGNGSDVEITMAVYPTGMGNGNRLESVKVLDLIEYIQENKVVWADGKSPEAKLEKKEAIKKTLDDEIPF